MRFPYIFLELLFFCLLTSALSQGQIGLMRPDSPDSIVGNYSNPGAPASTLDGAVLFRTTNSSGNPSIKTFKPGSTVISVMKGDSTIATFSVSGDDEVNVIVEFTTPPLSTIHSVREKSPSPRLQSALTAARTEHDRFKSDLPAIETSPPPRSRSTLGVRPSTIRYEYWTALNGVALTTRRWILDEIRKLPYVQSIDEDRVARAFDDSSNALIGAPQLWSAYNLHGDSIDIGILDTGIDYLHEALGAAPFPNSKVVGGYDVINNDSDPMDDNGHGTHVAGIAAGYGPPPVNLRGVAYGARLWAFKVLNSAGQGQFSQIIAGVDRALDPDNNPATPTPIQVLNLSIGGSGNPNDALSRSIDNAVNSGVVCAVAAGNSGGYYTINSPGCARRALTVGAVNNSDAIAYFSSRGPSDLLFAIKPDLVAPGFPVYSAKAGGGYLFESGTSMAAPHAAGAAAIMRQLHPEWTAEEIKANLMETAHDLSLDVWTQGHGRLDVFSAAQESVIVTPGSLSMGFDVTSQAIWTQRDTLRIFNSKNVPEIFQFSTDQALPSGISMTFDSSLVAVDAYDSSSVGLTFAVDNSLYAYPTTNPSAYVNKVIAQSTLTSERISIPFAFIKSPIFNLHFDVPPTLVDIHNNNDSAFFNVVYTNLISTGLSILVPADTYDVATFYYVDSQMVITENINVDGVKTVTIPSTNASNPLTMRMMDINGNEITARRLELESIVSKRSRFGISLFGEETHKKRFISNLSSDYLYELTAVPDLFPVGNVFYEFPYVVSGGITGPVTLQNNPADFKRVDYRFGVPPATTKLYLISVFNSPSFGVGTILGPFFSPFLLPAFYLPAPREESFPYTQHWLVRNSQLDILGNLLHRTGFVSVTEPDTIKFSWSTTGFNFGAAQFVSTRSTFTDPVGVTPPMWGAKVFNLGTQIDAQVATDSYFINPLGGRTVGPISYQLSSNGTPLYSGIIQNLPFLHLDTLLSLPAGPYELDTWFSRFRVGPRQGIAIARINGNSNNLGTVCPRFRKLQFLRNGELPDSLPVNQLAVVPKAVQGLDSISAFYRKSTDSAWIQLSLTLHDTTYTAALPETLGVGYYSTRVRVTDSLASSIDYSLEPGFTMPGTIVDKASQVFDTLHVGCRQTRYIGVQNLRLVGDVIVRSIVSDDSNFVLTGVKSGIVPASESLNCAVSFIPISGGEKHGNIIFTVDGIANPETVLVSGVGGSMGGEIVISTEFGTRWQIISTPVDPFCPTVMPRLYGFRGTYLIRDTLKPGEGYWKFVSDPSFEFVGFPLVTDTIDATLGWNLIGSLSTPMPTPLLVSIPDGMITSRVWGYSGGYYKSDSIMPACGYWVKVSNNCKLILRNSPAAMPKVAQTDLYSAASSLTITDAAKRSRTLFFGQGGDMPATQGIFELPPVPPEGSFDVRFGTNREYEAAAGRKPENFPIRIRSAEYPVTIGWDLKSPGTLAVLGIGSGKIELSGTGSTQITTATDTVVLRIAGSSPIPTTFALDPNYPNPFNPQTVIQYQLPVDSRVDLIIFNALGEEVATLAHGEEHAGYKSVTWNGSNVASGVYFCRLQAVGVADPAKAFTQMRKLVLLR